MHTLESTHVHHALSYFASSLSLSLSQIFFLSLYFFTSLSPSLSLLAFAMELAMCGVEIQKIVEQCAEVCSLAANRGLYLPIVVQIRRIQRIRRIVRLG